MVARLGRGALFSPQVRTCADMNDSTCGKASAVGQYAIQLGKIAGLKVATTASPKNHAKLVAFGADVVIDYKVSVSSPSRSDTWLIRD